MDDFESLRNRWRELRAKFMASGCGASPQNPDTRDLMHIELRLRRIHWPRLNAVEQYELDSRKFFAQLSLPEGPLSVSLVGQSTKDQLVEELAGVMARIIPGVIKRETEKDTSGLEPRSDVQ
ncbi:MAG TPA: hypothetical protein VNG29_00535 [Candidatus Paceibacterota bacterium]|nr:hypothetical protein [Candidatus Paceibacterota bacterium]